MGKLVMAESIRVDPDGLRMAAATALSEAADVQGVSVSPSVSSSPFAFSAAVAAIHASTAAAGTTRAGQFTATAHAAALAALAFEAADDENANAIQGVVR